MIGARACVFLRCGHVLGSVPGLRKCPMCRLPGPMIPLRVVSVPQVRGRAVWSLPGVVLRSWV